MSDNEKNQDHQFKSNENSGEHRNGRLSQFKNNNSTGKGTPNEYINKSE